MRNDLCYLQVLEKRAPMSLNAKYSRSNIYLLSFTRVRQHTIASIGLWSHWSVRLVNKFGQFSKFCEDLTWNKLRTNFGFSALFPLKNIKKESFIWTLQRKLRMNQLGNLQFFKSFVFQGQIHLRVEKKKIENALITCSWMIDITLCTNIKALKSFSIYYQNMYGSSS